MMTLQEFANKVKDAIKDYLPPEYQDVEVEVTTVPKNNGVEYTGLMLIEAESGFGPTLYLEDYYKEFESGTDLEDIMGNFADNYVECRETNTKEAVMNGLDMRYFESVKDKIGYQLINRKANEQMLENVPHREVEDLAAVYRIVIATEEAGASTVLVTNNIQEVWGVSADDLQKAADKNMMQLQTPTFTSMQNIMLELVGIGYESNNLLEQGGIHKGEQMYVLTNKDRMYGASAMLDPSVMEQVREILDSDYYILPSSIHEAIIVSKEENVPPETLGRMVREINRDHVDLEEILSNNVYEFNKGEKSFKQAAPTQPNREGHER